jgi:phosphopantothenate synthetase
MPMGAYATSARRNSCINFLPEKYRSRYIWDILAMFYASEIGVLREILKKSGATPADTLYVIIGDGDRAPVFKNIQKSPHIVTIDREIRAIQAPEIQNPRGIISTQGPEEPDATVRQERSSHR